MDLPPFQEWFIQLIAITSNFFVGLSAITVGVAAIVGVRQWHAQLVGQRKFDAAHRMMLRALEFKDEFRTARILFTDPSESAEREHGLLESADEDRILNERFARWNRLERLDEILRELRISTWEAGVMAIDGVDGMVRDLRHIRNEFLIDFEEYFEISLRLAKGESTSPEQLVKKRSLHKTIYAIGDNEYSERIEAVVEGIIQKLRPYVS